MAIDPFPTPTANPVKPPVAQTVRSIAMRVEQCGRTLSDTYKFAQDSIHANANYTEAEVIAALGADYAKLQLFAVLVKSIVNKVKPGTINDTVPEATITLPS